MEILFQSVWGDQLDAAFEFDGACSGFGKEGEVWPIARGDIELSDYHIDILYIGIQSRTPLFHLQRRQTKT
jgi:hypothetical protein